MSALSLSLRDKERFRDWEIERAWQNLPSIQLEKLNRRQKAAFYPAANAEYKSKVTFYPAATAL